MFLGADQYSEFSLNQIKEITSCQGRIILSTGLSEITYNQASKKILCNDYYIL
jgi:hypothetical protein